MGTSGEAGPDGHQEYGNFAGMSTAVLTILLAVCLLALAFAGIAVRILVKKDGKFAGTCASNNPLVQREGGACGYCGAKPEEQCQRE